MFSRYQSKGVINVMIFIIIISAIIIYAKEGGIIGKTQKNGFGCTCHSETPSANVLVAISGPDTLFVGQTATYTVTITGGPLVAGGTNIAASEGNLLPVVGDLRKESSELTHVAPKSPSAGKVTFQFSYTAPSLLGQQILYANGNSVNLNGFNTGDQWNFAPNKNINVVQPTSVNETSVINSFKLSQNFPNPFNPTTTIGFGIKEKGNVRMSVFDLIGEEIRVLLNEEKEAGNHSIEFNASDLPSGVYFYRIQTGNFINTKKMLLLK